MILPYIASEALGKLIRNEYVILFMEGIIRIAIFLGYIVLISRMEDIKRVFDPKMILNPGKVCYKL